MPKFRVVIPLPTRSEYIVEAPYPGDAKRQAARLHHPKLPKIPITDIAVLASCFRVYSMREGSGREKSHGLEDMLRNGVYK